MPMRGEGRRGAIAQAVSKVGRLAIDSIAALVVGGLMVLPDSAEAQPALRFWDGGDPAERENGVIDGGSGVWSATDPNWTDSSGTVNGPMRPVPAFTVFQGQADAHASELQSLMRSSYAVFCLQKKHQT